MMANRSAAVNVTEILVQSITWAIAPRSVSHLVLSPIASISTPLLTRPTTDKVLSPSSSVSA
jgi:hypothetical protein